MAIIRERIIGAVTIMTDREAERVWAIIQKEFAKSDVDWEDMEEVEASDEEKEIIAAYERGEENLQPYITHEELKKELDIE